jgi:quinol-cytochrome oxidoreductase complex cytochrome b subunit
MRNNNQKEKRFYPDYLVEILVIIIITIEFALALALLFPPDIGRKIDFNAMYQPKPEWYFLWLYELVKYFPGKLAFIGTAVLPLAVFLLITLAPFLDKTTETSLRKRWKAVLIASTLVISVVILTLRAM